MLRPRYNKRRYRGMREDGEVSVEYKKRTRSDDWGMGQICTHGGIRERQKVRTSGGTDVRGARRGGTNNKFITTGRSERPDKDGKHGKERLPKPHETNTWGGVER